MKRPKTSPSYITARSYKNYDSLSFASDLAGNSCRLLSIFYDGDVNTKLRIFNDILHSTLDSHAPVRTFKIRGRLCPYITHEIKELMRTIGTNFIAVSYGLALAVTGKIIKKLVILLKSHLKTQRETTHLMKSKNIGTILVLFGR